MKYIILMLATMLFSAETIAQTITYLKVSNNISSYWRKVNTIRTRDIVEAKWIKKNRYKIIQTRLTEKYVMMEDSTKDFVLVKSKTKSRKKNIKLDLNSLLGYTVGDSLIKNISYEQFRSAFKDISKKKVRSIAKDSKNFKNKYDKNISEYVMDDILLLKYLDSFYIKKVMLKGFLFTTDYTNYLEIDIQTDSSKLRLHQSFSVRKYCPPLDVYNVETSFDQRVFNPRINLELGKLITKNSLLKVYFKKDAIIEDYIIWFLENRLTMMMYEDMKSRNYQK